MTYTDNLLFGAADCPHCGGHAYVGEVALSDAREAQPCHACKANIAVFHPRAAVGERAVNCLQVMLEEEGWPVTIDVHQLKGGL